MTRYVISALLIAAVLVAAPLAEARKPRNPKPEAPPKTEAPARSVKYYCYILSSAEQRTTDGELFRDVIIMVEDMRNNGPVPVTFSYKNFTLKNKYKNRSVPCVGVNLPELEEELAVSSSDGELPQFKLYFKVPRDFDPANLSLKTDAEEFIYPVGL